ncbi:MAG: branched-chain amino acid ABC transporter permease [Opitutus sp.]|nr:branched-chain amino acid ABC transporter permease [Opitutus sp.]MCS6246351.1 branched-chain amino acid ABC transporter permease [Opitutus sp.]MCS6273198.1 branched-chain amino acid ABC transporter permease [Opitutus sp.]MCS6278319.1 branched-chain amino acid ABC transporter permease [Opitutus sp.]MCS6299429.1 branched-chain amino acid ABC transporter permease [Opitutus sp.]
MTPRRFGPPWPHLLLGGALLAAFLLTRWVTDPYANDVLTTIGINVILAVSLNLVNGYTGQFSLGHAGFMSVGAYLSAAITLLLGPSILGEDGGTPWAQNALFFGGLLVGGLSAAAAGLLVGIPSLRLRGDYLAIVTLGFGEIIRVIFQNIEPLGGALGLNGIPNYTTVGWTFAIAALTVFVVGCLINSTYGRGFIATHDDEIAAEAMGLNTTRYKVVAFVVGAFFAGLAGGLYGHFKMSITAASFDFTRSIEIVVMVILGGMGNTLGVILAAILLTLLPEVLCPIAEFRMILYALLLIVLMLLRPQGLFNFRRSHR